MNCSNCGNKLQKNAKFCTKCGAKCAEKSITNTENNKKKGFGIAVGILCAIIICLSLVVVFLLVHRNSVKSNFASNDNSIDEADNMDGDSDNSEFENDEEYFVDNVKLYERPSVINNAEVLYDESYEANAKDYDVNSDLSNVANLFQYEYLDDSMKKALAKDGFFVLDYWGNNEFFEVYEGNRYAQRPNFVTVDSLMHTYHLYFSHLLKSTEKEELSDCLEDITKKMYDISIDQYELLEGTDWEAAARRNVLFFTVAAALLDDNIVMPAYVEEDVIEELEKIYAAESIAESLVTNAFEDYSQYKVRGYYEGDKVLEKYFRAMMWYGRIDFRQEDENANKAALLVCLALNEAGTEDWERIYTITSFFAGSSDDLGYFEYLPIIESAYGKLPDVKKLSQMDNEYKKYVSTIKKCPPPLINSVVIKDGEDNEVKSFRFMGQRFSIDAAIFQKLIYQNVEDRYLPDVLDVPAVLGSQTAYSLLEEKGDTNCAGYTDNMSELKEIYNNADVELWNSTLYASWLNTLRPLLVEKGEGFPKFMQSKKWAKRDLECYAGSYTELKHDTVLYSKQVMSEMGGGDEEIIDDRGFVQPEPVVYARFASLAAKTREGLLGYDAISDTDAQNLKVLEEMAATLLEISKKELNDETLSDDEYEFIRAFGGNLEHLWNDAMKYDLDTDYVSTQECPAALVVDVATDPNGSVLELGNGKVQTIYVVAMVDGELKICSGSVYDFYQFEQPLGERLTDKEWQLKIGAIFEYDDDSYMMNDLSEDVKKPFWTEDYRLEWNRY